MADEHITALANRVKLKKSNGSKFVLMLGAGASLSSGIPPTQRMMMELVDRYGTPTEITDLEDRFDDLWASASESDRRAYLTPYLERHPSPGYRDLARLIDKGFFDLVITFNFDALLEQGLEERGVPASRYKVIIRGEVNDDKIRTLLEAKKPRIKILKMHGSLYSADEFLFSKEEMLNYPPVVEKVLEDITRRDVIVCGYAFADQCVIRAFSPKGGALACVNPAGPPRTLKGFVKARKSSALAFSGDLGRFDDFFSALAEALLQPTRKRKVVKNPFKFLESYSEEEAAEYCGRSDEVRLTLDKLEQDGLRAIHIVGPPRVGKTSFVRAGVFAALDSQHYQKIYLRCQAGLESNLAVELERQAGIEVAGGDLQETLRQLAAVTDKKVVLALDQFERVIAHLRADSDRVRLREMLTAFHPAGLEGLSVLFVGVDERAYMLQLIELVKATSADVVSLPRFEARRIEAIIRLQALRAGLTIDRRVIRDLVRKYEESKDTDKPFSLAHIEAVCHLLGREDPADWVAYRSIDDRQLRALDEAINEYDFVAFVEDFPLPQERILLLEIMKRVSSESKWKIAEFLKDHCAQLFLEQSESAAKGRAGLENEAEPAAGGAGV